MSSGIGRRYLLWPGPPILLRLALQFLGRNLLTLGTIAIVVDARLVFLMSFPAAPGALEISQVLAPRFGTAAMG